MAALSELRCARNDPNVSKEHLEYALMKACNKQPDLSAEVQGQCLPALKAVLKNEAWDSDLVQRVLIFMEDPTAEREPLLDDSNISFWSLNGIGEEAPLSEQRGYDVLSRMPTLCKKGSGIYNNLSHWAKGKTTLSLQSSRLTCIALVLPRCW